MSVLVVGLSHRSAPVPVLERAVVSGDALAKLLRDVRQSDSVAGSLVLSTCNRVEVYAEVDRFHGGLAAICELLARHSGLPLGELTGSAYVHYEDRAVHHLLAVACGLDSMVVGESQILGQVREAVRLARQSGTLSRELSDLSRLALRAGRRAHAETGIDAAGQSLVTLGLELAAGLHREPSWHSGPGERSGHRDHGASLDGASPDGASLDGASVLVVGAGSMSALAVATAVRHGARQVVIANRTPARAERLAARHGATAAGLAGLPDLVAAADLVVTCTGATGHVLSLPVIERALQARAARPVPAGQAGAPAARTPLVLLDLALPRDVEPAAGDLPGVRLVDLEAIGASGTAAGAVAGSWAAPGAAARPAGNPGPWSASEADVVAVRRIVAHELAAYLKADRAASVAPTVVALRAKAATVVESELDRLDRRLGDLDPRIRREIAQTMGRIADKLLHGPTVRVKELAGAPGADSYETALRVLFELDPDTVRSVESVGEDLLAWSLGEAAE